MNIIKNKRMLMPILLLILIIGYIIYYLMGPYQEIKKEKEANLLYTKIHEFLDSSESYSPEDFENVCIKYMGDNSLSPVILSKEMFDKKSENKLILYRGISGENAQNYANEFQSGNIYIGKNIDNVRGNGIYTTSNYKCAKYFTDDDGVVVTMFLNNKKGILENQYLEEIKDIMVKEHPDEFDYIVKSEKIDFLYNSMNNLLNEYLFKEYIPDFDVSKLDGLNQKEINKLMEELIPQEALNDMDIWNKIKVKIENDPRFSEIKKNRIKYFKDKKVALYYNSGLLAKLLGYNVLHTDKYDEELKVDIQEYLILDPRVITINSNR